MVLPFVREIFADAESLAPLARAASHLKEGTGRVSVSGLTPTAKALATVLLHRAAGRPLVLVVADNRAAEDVLPLLQSFCSLTGAAPPASACARPSSTANWHECCGEAKPWTWKLLPGT